MRESPSLKIIRVVDARGAKVDYNDPYFLKFTSCGTTTRGINRCARRQDVAGYDCVLIATDHTSYDYPMIVESSLW